MESTPHALHPLLFHPAASLAVHWLLLELGVDFEARRIDLDAGEQHSAEYLRINPSGRGPALIIDGKAHVESAALLMLLAERHPEQAWAPLPGSATRADWLQAMIHLANGVLPPMRDWFYADKDGAATDVEPVRRLARQLLSGRRCGSSSVDTKATPANTTGLRGNKAPTNCSPLRCWSIALLLL